MRAETGGRGDVGESVRFLTALLVRHPQVGAVRLSGSADEPPGRVVSLEFFLARRLGTARLKEFARDIREAHEVLAGLKSFRPSWLKILRGGTARASASSESFESSEDLQDRVDSVILQRDLRTFSLEDLSLLVALVEQEFERDLVVGEDFQEEDDGYQEEVLVASLDRIRYQTAEADLVGFRDDMRVLVYPCSQGDGWA